MDGRQDSTVLQSIVSNSGTFTPSGSDQHSSAPVMTLTFRTRLPRYQGSPHGILSKRQRQGAESTDRLRLPADPCRSMARTFTRSLQVLSGGNCRMTRCLLMIHLLHDEPPLQLPFHWCFLMSSSNLHQMIDYF